MPADRKLNILMLEDNPADADVNAEQLTDAGLSFEYRRVESEQDYVKELAEFKPDIILADYRLPGFDGLAALRLVRERFPFIPFILVTGVLEEEAAAELFRAGATDYLRKGKTARLGTAVKNALELKAAQEEKARAEEELRRSFRELERRVEERTRQLVRMNEELRESELRYSALFNTRSNGIVHWKVVSDERGKPVNLKFLRVNSAYEKIMGIKKEWIEGKTLTEAFPGIENFPQDYIGKYGDIALHGGELVWEDYFEPVGIWVSDYVYSPMPGEVTVIFTDITERKKSEETLRRNEYELRTLVDNSPDLIFRLNRQLQYVYVNPAYERLTGIPKEQFIGKTNKDLGMSTALTGFWQSAVLGVMESGREHSTEFDTSSFFGKRYFSARLIPEFEKSGLVETVLVIARDITERKQAEERIRYISFHDDVTGLFNRAFFEEELRRVDSERELPVSIIMGDVNNLKLSNDVFGHEEGDKLLRAIADSIRKACRQNDIIARLGGDEFAVILPKTDLVTADGICASIREIARGEKGTALPPSVAVGIAAKEQREQNIYQVIRRAEQHMYDYKLGHAEENERAMLSALSGRAREKIPDHAGHIDRSHELARRFGDELQLTEEQRRDLMMLIELHDLGDAIVPKDILAKPGRLSAGEWEIMKKHAEAGFRIVKTYADTARISDEVLAHGERWDGSGYPRRLSGKAIPYLARVFLIIDAFDVMTHPRPYDKTLSREEAVAELRRNAGRQFDPELTERFILMLTKEPAAAIP